MNTSEVQLDSLLSIQAKIAELKTALQNTLPGYETLLQVIHRNLAEDDSLAHLLKETEIGIIVTGLQRKKNISLVAEKTGKTKSKSLKNITVEDLI